MKRVRKERHMRDERLEDWRPGPPVSCNIDRTSDLNLV